MWVMMGWESRSVCEPRGLRPELVTMALGFHSASLQAGPHPRPRAP